MKKDYFNRKPQCKNSKFDKLQPSKNQSEDNLIVDIQTKRPTSKTTQNKVTNEDLEDLNLIEKYTEPEYIQKIMKDEDSLKEEDDLELLQSFMGDDGFADDLDDRYDEPQEIFNEDSYEEIISYENQAKAEGWAFEEGDSDAAIDYEKEELKDKKLFAMLQDSPELSSEEALELAAGEPERDAAEESDEYSLQDQQKEIAEITDRAETERWFDDIEDEEINQEVEKLEAQRIIAKLEDSPDLLKEQLLDVVSKEVEKTTAKKKAVPAQQAADSVSPYEYGKRVMSANELCYIGDMLHKFNGKYWQMLDDESLKQLVYDSMPEAIKLSTKGVETFIANISSYVKREMKKAYDNGKKRFTSKDFQAIENRIVFQNLVYDIQTGKLHKFTSALPYYYAIDCDYLESDFETPYYEKLKSDATGGDRESMEMFDLLQAYLMIPNRKGKCFFIMSYAKDSGKTSFGEFIEGYFPGDMVQKIDMEHLGSKFSYAGMERALLVNCLEMPVARLTRSAANALKNFTGESRIEIEAKYQNRITSKVRFKTLLASNGGLYLPTGYSDQALYRRAIVIPFIHSVPLDRLSADLPEKLESERSAIISKCVRKLGKLIAEDGGIVFPESQLSKEIKAGWTGQSLISENFVMKALVFTARNEDAISKMDLKAEYDRYFAENVRSTGNDLPLQCSKEELVKLVHSIYPNTMDKRLRRPTLNNPEASLQHCITGIQWADGYGRRAAETDGS